MIKSDPYLKVATQEVQSYLIDHANDDERALVLKTKQIHGVDASIIADQLAGRRKAKTKLTSFYEVSGIIYPPSVSMEQCSSELTAKFKATVVGNLAVPRHAVAKIADLTGGFGIDSYFLSKIGQELHYVEQDGRLLEIARHNHARMGVLNIIYHHQTAEEFLARNLPVDLFYVDPSRRINSRKVFRLAECHPDVARLLPAMLHLAKSVLIKASPLLDINQARLELGKVEEIFVVSVDHECRELLICCSEKFSEDPLVTGINLDTNSNEQFLFHFSEERNTTSTFNDPLGYLYEPYSWVLKTGSFKTIGVRYGLHKIQINTHLYTSDKYVEGFPGRIFRIEQLRAVASEMKKNFPEGKANVIVRNYPLKPEEIRKKYKLVDGGKKYLIGFSGVNQKFLVIGERVK